ncbi:MAG: hypothetical protein O7H41_03825 [Planctomycetota bacterium]|nr:hypothetical protein [Planctomycetota bacterium]
MGRSVLGEYKDRHNERTTWKSVRPRPREKDPGLALTFAFLVTGLGHFYIQKIRRGILFMAGQAANVIIILVVMEGSRAALPIFLLTAAGIWIAGMWDAYEQAHSLNARIALTAQAKERAAKEVVPTDS